MEEKKDTVVSMKKYRVNTTISPEHHEILLKHRDKLGTKQKVLEQALESLENNGEQPPELSRGEKQWIRNYREMRNTLTVLPHELLKTLLKTADIDGWRAYIDKVQLAQFGLEYFYNKPLKEFSLQEVIEGIVFTIKLQGSSDTINYTDNGDHFMINVTQSLGIFCSEALIIMFGSVLNTYGAKFETHFTERSFYFKIYKN